MKSIAAKLWLASWWVILAYGIYQLDPLGILASVTNHTSSDFAAIALLLAPPLFILLLFVAGVLAVVLGAIGLLIYLPLLILALTFDGSLAWLNKSLLVCACVFAAYLIVWGPAILLWEWDAA